MAMALESLGQASTLPLSPPIPETLSYFAIYSLWCCQNHVQRLLFSVRLSAASYGAVLLVVVVGFFSGQGRGFGGGLFCFGFEIVIQI